MSGLLARLGARLVRATHFIDTTYQRFDRVRSRLVLAVGSTSFYETYSKLAYGATSAYRADAEDFRRNLFAWEDRAIAGHFPPPPARVLIGGAGGGREAFALVDRGYTVVAFEPAPPLARSMGRVARARMGEKQAGSLEAFCGSYENLPIVRATEDSKATDLSRQPLFDAAILGWTSFSHLTTDEARVAALKAMAAITRGPLLVSYFGQSAPDGAREMFTIAMGYTRLLSEADLRSLAQRAGLGVAFVDRDSTWPNAVLRAP